MVKIQKQIPPASAALGVGMTKLEGTERERDLEEQERNSEKLGRNLEEREERKKEIEGRNGEWIGQMSRSMCYCEPFAAKLPWQRLAAVPEE